MMEPGASGALAAKLAPLTAADNSGAGEGSPSPPDTSRVPVRFCAALVAVSVSVTGPGLLPACQVLCHIPACWGCKLSGGSPLENDIVTLPLLSALPQSSRTSDSIAIGHAAGSPNDCPKVVMIGTNCVGVHPALPWAPSPIAEAPAGGAVTIVLIPTRRMLPSENCSVSSALYTPADNPLVTGCTTTRVGCEGKTVDVRGPRLN